MPTPLPRNEYGHIDCSASYGETQVVLIEWSTDWDGREIDISKEDPAKTYHGPFYSDEEVQEWINDFPEFTEIYEMTPIVLNSVRPKPSISFAKKTWALMRPLRKVKS